VIHSITILKKKLRKKNEKLKKLMIFLRCYSI
jgi:hypothetical protein